MHYKKPIKGKVVSGLGEAKMFMSMPYYKKQITEKLGFEAFSGTLNIQVETPVKMDAKDAIKIEGYMQGSSIFGGATFYRAKIKNVRGALIFPDVNKHEANIIEFIAPVNLKDKLKLKDNDLVEVDLT